MDDMEDIQLKMELEEISQRIDSTLEKIDTILKPRSEISDENTD